MGSSDLSFAQKRLWLLDRLLPLGAIYNLARVARLNGVLDIDALRQALNEMVRRHDMLRSRFAVENAKPAQVSMPELKLALDVEDLGGLPKERRKHEAQQRVQDEAQAPFDLEQGPLVRARLLRLGAHEHWLLLTFHHIISDDWSLNVFWRELSTLYDAHRLRAPSRLAALPMQYADYGRWQREWLQGEVLEHQLAYWKQALAELSVLGLPTDRVRPSEPSYQGRQLAFNLGEELTRSLRALGHREGTTFFTTLLAALQVLLYRYSGQEDVAVGVPVAGRRRPDIEGLIGFFVNTLVMRGDLSGEPTFRDYLGRVRLGTQQAYTHQDIPFEILVEKLNPERDSTRNPFFQVMLTQWNPEGQILQLTGLEPADVVATDTGTAMFDLGFTAVERQGQCKITIEYATDLFDTATIERMGGHFQVLLEAIVADPEQRIGQLPLLTAVERHQMLVEWNDTEADYPIDRCIHQLFEAQAARTPEAVAAVFEDRQLTYAELNARSNQLAHHLTALGVGSETQVGICMERSLEMIVGLLGILKAGAAYVPLDPDYPVKRLEFMLTDSAAAVLVTQRKLLGQLPSYEGRILCLDRDWKFIAAQPETTPPRHVSAENLAYVIYTSGSTGRPKGIPITHRSLCNLVCWHQQAYEVTPADRATQVAGPAFDASAWEIWPYLTAGASIHIVDKVTRQDPALLVRWLTEQRITLTFLPTPLAEAALRQSWPQRSVLRLLLTGGDKLNHRLLHKLPFRLVNHYGPTENTVVSTCAEVSVQNASHKAPPIGRPLPNTRAYVLNSHLQPVPIGVPGELLVGGVQLAAGYWNRPELTAANFVPDPFSGEVGARLYHTGDLVCYRPDGNIEFLGRLDDQVKIRGFRVELGEIEAVLLEHPAVREAVVIAREDIPGDQRLVAYVVLSDALCPGSESQLRALSREHLPEYMRPSAYVILEQLPLTPNGKVDRAALPAPEGAGGAACTFEAPIGEIETALAEIWADMLKLERVGRRDHFFELGGHSLLAVSVLERMRQAGLHADVRTLFVTPTLAELAAAVGGDGGIVEVPPNRIPSACDAITPEMLPLIQLTSANIRRIAGSVPGGAANIQDIYPLAPLQEGILFHHIMATEGDPYLLSALFAFGNRARLHRYLQALQAVIDRHDILRTAVLWEELPEPVQVVWRQAPLAVEEVSILTAAGDVGQQLRARFDPRHYRFDVRQAPLVRAFIAHDAANSRWMMLQLFHHLSLDHTTLEIVQQEIQAYLLGRAGELPAPLPFRNFVAQARLGVSKEEHKAFFQKMLGDVDEPSTPFGLTDVYGDGSGIVEARRNVDASLARRLRERARGLGVSAASVCHLAWAQVLARVSGRDDVVFGTVLFGRMQGGSGADRAMGLFINTLPIRIRVGDEGAQDSVRQTHSLLAQLLRHEHAPLALAQRCSAVAATAPLFTALLNYRHSTAAAHVTAEALQAQDGIEFLGDEERTNYPFTLSVDDLGEGLELKAQVQSPLDAQRVCAFMHTALEQLVGALEHAPTTPLRSLDVLPESERHQLLVEWNDTAADYPRDRCIHQLFEAQVARTPETVAVVFEDRQLTYAELNARSNQLAYHLIALGVGPEVLVGICLERSLELIVGLLGILKADGAYVPLDPSYPQARLAFMLKDARTPVLLTQQTLLGKLPPFEGRLVCIDRDWKIITKQPETDPPHQVTAENLAYVIYTSGSTGKPRGVEIGHRALTNFLWSMRTEPGCRERDRLLSVTSMSFDIAGLEMYLPLIVGGRVEFASREVASDADLLKQCIERCNPTLMQATPATWRMLIEANWRGAPQMVALCGGEALPRDLAGELFARTAAFWNMYGPTESTVWSTVRKITPHDGRVTIGRPIANTSIYILDQHRQPAPVGVAGELYIGGDGVARGYLSRPKLTAEKFLSDPFSNLPGARMYSTGDLARYLPDGNIEFLGRIDNQVKIRGFRIELGEIEAVLAEHATVRHAVVLAREDTAGDKRLVAYVVADEGALGQAMQSEQSTGWSVEHVSEWRELWEQTYVQPSSEDATFNITGWNSSYTGAPIPAEEMQEWVDATVERIVARRPRRVLEIGCGTGLLLARLAPACEAYLGVDFSSRALDHVRQLVAARKDLSHVELSQRMADDFAGIEPGSFDTAIINSVVQYFPGIEYLKKVLEGAATAVSPGGRIFIGDVRNLPLLKAFHASVQCHRADGGTTKAQLERLVENDIEHEGELVIDPDFFVALKEKDQRISDVEILLKRGCHQNELTRFRYDAFLHIQGRDGALLAGSWMDWQQEGSSLENLQSHLTSSHRTLGIRGVPNARWIAAAKVLDWLASEEGPETLEGFKDASALAANGAVEPEALWSLGEQHGYVVELSYSGADISCMDVLFRKRDTVNPESVFWGLATTAAKSSGAYANKPLKGKLVRELTQRLRKHLAAALPDYMVPAAFVMLDAIPLTPNGKIDRKSLPAPGRSALPQATYTAPRTPGEKIVVSIWAEVLQLDRVGAEDNFFELGGHSLLAIKFISLLRAREGIDLPVSMVFESPTPTALAERFTIENQTARNGAAMGTGRFTIKQKNPIAARSDLTPIAEILGKQDDYVKTWVGKRSTPEAFIVTLNDSGRRQGLFWCLQGYRELTQLAKHLGPDQPVHGMRSGHLIMEYTDANLHAIALYYAAEMIALQPDGSFLLGGNCQGGVVAHAIALRLRELRRPVSLLLLMEQERLPTYEGPVALIFGRDSHVNPYKPDADPDAVFRRTYPAGFTVDIIGGGHGQFFESPNVETLASAVSRRLPDAIRDLVSNCERV